MNSNEAIKQAIQAGPVPVVLSLRTEADELLLKRPVIPDVAGFPVLRHRYRMHRRGRCFTTIVRGATEFVRTAAPSLLQLPAAEHAA